MLTVGYRILQQPELKIQLIPLQAIRFANYNPRKISTEQMTALVGSMQRFGFVEPVVVNQRRGHGWPEKPKAKEFACVGGHQRIKAARELKHTQAPCVVVQLNYTEERSLNVALNKISGEWDIPVLQELLKSLKLDNPDTEIDYKALGWSDAEIHTLLAQPGEFGAVDPSEQGRLDEKRAVDHDVTCPECGHEFQIKV